MGPVSELYSARVQAGQLEDDAAQRRVLAPLDALVEGLSAALPSDGGGGWKSWFGAAPTPAPSGPKGIYLWGGVGRGKSMLMDMVMEAATIPARRRVHFHSFMQEIQSGLNEARKRGDQDAVRPVAEAVAAQARLLCFDEMQITDIADAMIVGRLFQVLSEHGVCIVTTSNRIPEDLYKNGLNRQLFLPFIALIRDNMDVLALDSDTDHRHDREHGARVWFSPLTRDNRAAMDRIWDDLAPSPTPLALPVQGRTVNIAAHQNRAARVGFWELCGRPLGAADYLTLADAVDVLMIDDVPLLSSSNFNEAKRFVTLIDALYEAHVRVIASAAAEPERLYVEGEGSFEFARTASRLYEMQDRSWGSRDDQALSRSTSPAR